MASVLSLFVIIRVEVDVVQNDNIRSRQVDTKTTSLRRQQEDKDRRICVEKVNHLLTTNNIASHVQLQNTTISMLYIKHIVIDEQKQNAKMQIALIHNT